MIEQKQNKLFFIVGVGRSGTSLLQEIMCTFSGFCNKKESKVGGPRSMSCWTSVRRNNDFSGLENFIVKNWISEFFVEKTPDSILCIPQMSKKYPNANYIFLERNPYDVVLSQLNLFSDKSQEILERKYHIENLIMEKDDLLLNSEQYWSKLTLYQISQILSNKNMVKKSLTFRYEHLINSLESALELLEIKFGITKNILKALDVIKKPSYSSSDNKYEIKKITDKQANEMINEAKNLLNY